SPSWSSANQFVESINVPTKQLPDLFSSNCHIHSTNQRQPFIRAIAERRDFTLWIYHRFGRISKNGSGRTKTSGHNPWFDVPGSDRSHHVVSSTGGNNWGIFQAPFFPKILAQQ